jgi:hypothetical protein
MIGFYSRFIKGCHHMLAPFHDLKAKNAPSKEILGSLRFWASFECLKKALIDVAAISRPDYSKPFYVDVDTAVTGATASALSQREQADEPDSHLPLGFHSQRLNDTEKAYDVRELECLGLLRSLRHWRSYILGSEIIVRCDHKSLQWLLKSQHRQGSRVGEWAVETSEYSPAIEYIPGKLNVVADFFSRADTCSTASAGDLAGEFAAHARWEGDTCVISLSTTDEGDGRALSLCTVRAREAS